jgi:hypothetical protein
MESRGHRLSLFEFLTMVDVNYMLHCWLSIQLCQQRWNVAVSQTFRDLLLEVVFCRFAIDKKMTSYKLPLYIHMSRPDDLLSPLLRSSKIEIVTSALLLQKDDRG